MSVSYNTTIKQKMISVMNVALGKTNADLAVINGDIVNVYTGEMQKKHAVLIKGNTIAYVGEHPPAASITSDTHIIDAPGKTLIPGLIDAHTHSDDQYIPGELAKYALTGGTTTIITETAAIGALMGYQGVIGFMKECRNQPVRFFFTIPPILCVSPTANSLSLTDIELKHLLRRNDVVGLGELAWAQVNESYPRLLDMIALTMNMGKQVDGHSAGANDNKLQAFFSTGISSCHEPISMNEVLERLRVGVFVPIREGAVRKELPQVSSVKDANIDFNLLGISSDSVDPRQLAKEGYMDFIVQKAINSGFSPVLAIQMASINAARHFKLNFLGGIAPGKLADIVIIPNLRTIKAETVIINGEVVVEAGEIIVNPRKKRFSPDFYNSVRLTKDFKTDDFIIYTAHEGVLKARIIDQISPLVTREAITSVTGSNGTISTDIEKDLLKVAVIDRYCNPGKFFVGLIRGFKLKRGAIATSTGWDCAHIVVVGANETDMALAVNRIRELQGGTVVSMDKKVIAELPLPIAGLFSDKPMDIIAKKYDFIQNATESLGTKLPNVRLSLQVLTTPSIPFLRICEEGLFDLKQNRFVSLLVE